MSAVIYNINGVDVIEIRSAGPDKTESVCNCPSCGREEKLYINKIKGAYECKVCGFKGYIKDFEPVIGIEEKHKNVDYNQVDVYISILVSTLEINEYVRSYFLEKKIPIELAEKYKIGYCTKEHIEYYDKKFAQEIFLLNKDGRNPHFGRIVFPITANGKYVYATSRALGLKPKVKFLDTSLKKKLFNIDNIDKSKRIYLCEGIPDTLSMIAHGFTNSVGILGATCINEVYSLTGCKEFTIAFDNDEGGKKGAKALKEVIQDIQASYNFLVLPDKFDVSDYFSAGNKVSDLQTADDIDLTVSSKELLFIRSEPNLMIYKYGELAINVRDIVPRKNSLKCTLEVFSGDTPLLSSSIELNSLKMRNSYAKELSAIIKYIPVSESKSMMVSLMHSIRQNLKDIEEENLSTKNYVMTDVEKSDAIKLLKDESFLFKVKQALDRQDIVGEDVNKILLYIIYSSRLMKKPISCIIKGLSSSGKTYLMGKTLALIPPEGYMTLQQTTSRSFYYMGENDLSHKMIIIGEMHGAEDSQYSLREAQDGIGEGDLVIATVEKDSETNQMRTVIKRVKGPCGFVSSTTDVEIHPENETRNFSLFVRIDERKVKDTARPLIEKYTGKSNPLSQEEILLFHNAQRCLELNIRVKIPYIKYILDRFPTSPIRVMRDRARFCVLLETIAMIHQFQRKIETDEDGEKWLIASIADYNIALRLMDEILIETIFELPKKSLEIFELVKEMRDEYIKNSNIRNSIDPLNPGAGFFTTYKRIGEKLKMRASDVRRWAHPLFEAGYFDYAKDKDGHKNKGGRGNETKLIPIDKDFIKSFLPSPDDVATFLNKEETIYDPLTGETRIAKSDFFEVSL